MKKETAEFIMRNLKCKDDEESCIEYAEVIKEVMEAAAINVCPRTGYTELVATKYPELMNWRQLLSERYWDNTIQQHPYLRTNRIATEGFALISNESLNKLVIENLKYIRLDDFIRFYKDISSASLSKALDECIREDIDVEVITESLINICCMTKELMYSKKECVPPLLPDEVFDRLIDEVIGRDNEKFMDLYKGWVQYANKKTKVLDAKIIREEVVPKYLSEIEENKLKDKQLLVIKKISRVKKRYPNMPENKWYDIGMLYLKINPVIMQCEIPKVSLKEIEIIKYKLIGILAQTNITINDFRFEF